MFLDLNKISIKLMSLSGNTKRLLVIITDACFCIFFFYVAFYLRINESPLINFNFIILSVISSFILIFFLWIFGITKEIIRYSNSTIVLKCTVSIFAYAIVFFLVNVLLNIYSVPRTIFIIHPILLFMYLIIIRLIIKYFLNTFSIKIKENQNKKNILIYGAGNIGIILSNILSIHDNFHLVGFIDDNKELVGRTVNGKNIYSYK